MEALLEAASVKGFSDWQAIKPDKYYDWIEQRSGTFTQFYPIGSKDAKAGKADDAIFGLFSNGYKTGRDAYIYNFSPTICAEYAQLMTEEYLNALSEFEENPKLTVDEVTRRYATNIKWDRELKNNLKRKKKTIFDEKYIQKSCASTICHYELLCRLHLRADEVPNGSDFPIRFERKSRDMCFRPRFKKGIFRFYD